MNYPRGRRAPIRAAKASLTAPLAGGRFAWSPPANLGVHNPRLDGSDADIVIVDGPPGIGCPVISACAGADLAMLVAEPTVSGIHDLERVLGTTNHFGVPALVCVNKADINVQRTSEIEAFCEEQGVPVVGRISYDTVVTEAMVHGLPVTAYRDCAVTDELRRLWAEVGVAFE